MPRIGVAAGGADRQAQAYLPPFTSRSRRWESSFTTTTTLSNA
ncbi:MAG: hypothetical protein VKJ05_03560 [Synechococcaceae cyanobacterium]|nr:hypothetical protein [Synechococcaceae cyanobacterium]